MESTFDTGLGGGRKATIFGIIVAFHALLVWALMTSLGTIIVDRLPPIIKAEIIEEIADDEEPPPPPPTIETPPPYVPPPDILIDVPMDAPATTALTQVTNIPKPVAPPPAQATIRIAPKVDKRFASRMKPEYPPTSRRLVEEGLVVVECLVNVEGKCQEVKLKTSSGFARLDEAVLKHAPRAWRLTPGTEDGKPVPQWISVPIRFKVTD